MKKIKTCLTALATVLLIGGLATANECPCQKATNVEVYAHPSLFGSQAFEYSTDDGTYVKGGHVLRALDGKTIRGKKDVAVRTWANSMLDLIKVNYTNAELFNPKMPVLRSEWAVTLSEGFSVAKNNACAKKYKDISTNYWATNWICGALDTGMMIGYPSDVFKPDQPITKAEVFATIATIVDATPDDKDKALMFRGQEMQYIPNWAKAATAEVLATDLLEKLPDAVKIANSEYLTKEQVVYLIANLRLDLAYYQNLKLDKNAPLAVKKYAPVTVSIKLNDRLSAKTSNIGDKFTAKTTKAVTINGVTFPVKSTVYGRVLDVQRPNIHNPGYIKVKFVSIENGKTKMEFPKTISDATAANAKSPFFLGRILGAPFSASARVVGVIGRTGGSVGDICGNRLEESGDNMSDVFVETFSGHPGSGAKSFGYSIWALGKGVFDLSKTTISGVFGVVYEVADELVYVILPSASNSSSLNPNEELIILF